MDDNNLYVVIETGGSIGENAVRGTYRIVGHLYYDNKVSAKDVTRRMSKMYGGGYYAYHYRTQTLYWAKRNCDKSEWMNLRLSS